MAIIVITKEFEFSYDVSVYENNELVKKTWAMNHQQAIGKAELLADYYKDDYGQRSGVIDNSNL